MADKKLRTYTVTNHKAKTVRLIKAANQAQAQAHVVRDDISVSLASQDDLVHLISEGLKVEVAGAEPETQTQLALEPAAAQHLTASEKLSPEAEAGIRN